MKQINNLATVLSLNTTTESHLAEIEVEFSATDIKRLIEAACEQLPQRKKVQEDKVVLLKLTTRLFGNCQKVAVSANVHCNKEYLMERGTYKV